MCRVRLQGVCQLCGGATQHREEPTNQVALADSVILSADVHCDFRAPRPDGNRHGYGPQAELQLLIGQRVPDLGHVRQPSSNYGLACRAKSCDFFKRRVPEVIVKFARAKVR
jgi:hypothetical protein